MATTIYLVEEERSELKDNVHGGDQDEDDRDLPIPVCCELLGLQRAKSYTYSDVVAMKDTTQASTRRLSRNTAAK